MNVALTRGRTPKCLSANCGVQRVSVKNSTGETSWKNGLRVKCAPGGSAPKWGMTVSVSRTATIPIVTAMLIDAQALARKMIVAGKTPDAKARDGFLRCASRPPTDEELRGLVNLFSKTHARFQAEPDKAKELATKPLGDAPKDMDIDELAAWTVVGNVLLNLDEMLMKR